VRAVVPSVDEAIVTTPPGNARLVLVRLAHCGTF
jgi:hypothetical protein